MDLSALKIISQQKFLVGALVMTYRLCETKKKKK
jgi:hypothetical protein